MEKKDSILNDAIQHVMENISLGNPMDYGNLEVFPVFSRLKPKTKYIMLPKGLKTGKLEIKEKEVNPTVPELMVENKGKKYVLLVDGEELKGAKQNRILNTSILVDKKSKIIIPVSCTEAGRWRYNSPNFADSGVQATLNMRAKNTDAVHYSLKKSQKFETDQKEVWDDIFVLYSPDILPERVKSSETQAMRDFYVQREEKHQAYLKNIKRLKKQRGVLVKINGVLAGFDYFSSAKALKSAFPKLLKSYAVEADLRKNKKYSIIESSVENVFDIFRYTKWAVCQSYKSPGLGYDLRIEHNIVYMQYKDFPSDKLTGHALWHKNEIIHLALFVNRDKSTPLPGDNDNNDIDNIFGGTPW